MLALAARFSLIAAFLAVCDAQTSQQTYDQCLNSGISATQCSVCPYSPNSSIGCASFDAGFDNLPDSGPVGIYKSTLWDGFYVLTQTQDYNATTIGPYTKRHYAAVPPGGMGTMSFGKMGGVDPFDPALGQEFALGGLRYFHYACASPDSMDPPTPIKCRITIQASCLAAGASDFTNGPFVPFIATLNYDPAFVNRNIPITQTGMAYQSVDFASTFGPAQGLSMPQRCKGYSFRAEGVDYDTTQGPSGTVIVTGLKPGPVVLLDDVIFNTYYRSSIANSNSVNACNAKSNCAPSGYDAAYYPNKFLGYSSGSVQSNYYIVEGLSPIARAVTNSTFYPQTPDPTGTVVYPNSTFPDRPYFIGATRQTSGGLTVDANNFTMVYRGLYKAPLTGEYTICSSADNQNDVYVGDGNAYNCKTGLPGTAANPVLSTSGARLNNPVMCAKVSMLEGLYYPIRSVAGNKDYGSAFSLTIQPPGTALSSNDWSGFAYPQSCGTYA